MTPRDFKALFTSPILIGLLVFAGVMWTPAVLNDSDTWWHVTAGQWILSHHVVPHTDPFSFTFAGKPWIAHEWLSEVIMACAFVAQWRGLMLLTAAACGITAWLLAREAARHLKGLPLWLLVLGGLSLAGPHLLARPHILVTPIMALWFIGLLRARDQDRAPRWALLPLMVLWANMHGSFLIGLALIAPFALEAVLAGADRAKTALHWAAFGAAATAACLATPFGLDGLLFPIRLILMPGVTDIQEWAPLDLTKPEPLTVALVAFLFVWLRQKPRIGVVRGLTLAGLVVMSLNSQRHELILGMVAVLLLARPLGESFGHVVNPQPAPRLTAAVMAALVLIVAATRLAVPLNEPINAKNPYAALQALPPILKREPVFNDYTFGGYLIHAGIRPFVDSRADMYGPAFLNEYAQVYSTRPEVLGPALQKYGITWTLLKPTSRALRAMDKMPGWHRLYADSRAVVHVRDDVIPPRP